MHLHTQRNDKERKRKSEGGRKVRERTGGRKRRMKKNREVEGRGTTLRK